MLIGVDDFMLMMLVFHDPIYLLVIKICNNTCATFYKELDEQIFSKETLVFWDKGKGKKI